LYSSSAFKYWGVRLAGMAEKLLAGCDNKFRFYPKVELDCGQPAWKVANADGVRRFKVQRGRSSAPMVMEPYSGRAEL
jgi:hypothetical protein